MADTFLIDRMWRSLKLRHPCHLTAIAVKSLCLCRPRPNHSLEKPLSITLLKTKLPDFRRSSGAIVSFQKKSFYRTAINLLDFDPFGLGLLDFGLLYFDRLDFNLLDFGLLDFGLLDFNRLDFNLLDFNLLDLILWDFSIRSCLLCQSMHGNQLGLRHASYPQ